MKVKIRFNTNYPQTSDKKWRVIVDETEHLVDAIEVLCKTFTTEDQVVAPGGQKVTKYHVSCKAKSVALVTANGNVKAKIK